MAERIIYVDLNNRTAYSEEYSFREKRLYGRGLVLEIFRKHVPDETSRFSPDNLIVIAPGLFAGNQAPSACRMSVATIESRDGGVQVCNTTGNMPQKLGSMGIAAIAVKGASAEKGMVVHIGPDGVRFSTDDSLTGRKTPEIIHELKARYGRNSAIIGAGTAADMRMPLSTFFCTYPDGIPEYHSPRNGFGDVWGAKNLKAIVVEADGYFDRECADPERFRTLGRRLADKLVNDEICGKALPSYGSITLMKILESSQPLDELKKDEKPPVAATRGERRINRNCAPMCVIGCLNRHSGRSGERYSSPAQIETQAAIERCFGIDDYELAARIQTTATDIGIVATEFVTSCKTFAEACGIENGEEHLLSWLREVEEGSLTGRVIASRTSGVAQLYSDEDLEDWIDRRAVQDEELFDVRMSTAYSSLQGLSELDILYAQIFVLENLGFCIFTSFALLDKRETFEIMAEMFEARIGEQISAEELISDARNCLMEERKYRERRWHAAQRYNIPPFTKVLYRYFDKRSSIEKPEHK